MSQRGSSASTSEEPHWHRGRIRASRLDRSARCPHRAGLHQRPAGHRQHGRRVGSRHAHRPVPRPQGLAS